MSKKIVRITAHEATHLTLEILDDVKERLVVQLPGTSDYKSWDTQQDGKSPDANNDASDVMGLELVRSGVDDEDPPVDGDHGNAEGGDEHYDYLDGVEALAPERAHMPAARRDRDEKRRRAYGHEEYVRKGQIEHEGVPGVAQLNVNRHQVDYYGITENSQCDYEQVHDYYEAQKRAFDFYVTACYIGRLCYLWREWEEMSRCSK